MSVQAYEKIVKQIEQESDSRKIAGLAKKLNDAMVAEKKVKHRLGISPDNTPAGRRCEGKKSSGVITLVAFSTASASGGWRFLTRSR